MNGKMHNVTGSALRLRGETRSNDGQEPAVAAKTAGASRSGLRRVVRVMLAIGALAGSGVASDVSPANAATANGYVYGVEIRILQTFQSHPAATTIPIKQISAMKRGGGLAHR